MIDHEKIGYSLTDVIKIIAKNYKIVDIDEKVSKFENVCDVYDVTGTTYTIIIAKFKEIKHICKGCSSNSKCGKYNNTCSSKYCKRKF